MSLLSTEKGNRRKGMGGRVGVLFPNLVVVVRACQWREELDKLKML